MKSHSISSTWSLCDDTAWYTHTPACCGLSVHPVRDVPVGLMSGGGVAALCCTRYPSELSQPLIPAAP